jgi:hypothetical protein
MKTCGALARNASGPKTPSPAALDFRQYGNLCQPVLQHLALLFLGHLTAGRHHRRHPRAPPAAANFAASSDPSCPPGTPRRHPGQVPREAAHGRLDLEFGQECAGRLQALLHGCRQVKIRAAVADLRPGAQSGQPTLPPVSSAPFSDTYIRDEAPATGRERPAVSAELARNSVCSASLPYLGSELQQRQPGWQHYTARSRRAANRGSARNQIKGKGKRQRAKRPEAAPFAFLPLPFAFVCFCLVRTSRRCRRWGRSRAASL